MALAPHAINPKEHMLRSMKHMEHYAIRATDGSLGAPKDLGRSASRPHIADLHGKAGLDQ